MQQVVGVLQTCGGAGAVPGEEAAVGVVCQKAPNVASNRHVPKCPNPAPSMGLCPGDPAVRLPTWLGKGLDTCAICTTMIRSYGLRIGRAGRRA